MPDAQNACCLQSGYLKYRSRRRKRNNVIVVNTPGRNAVGVAEMVVGMMISVSRNFYKGEK